MVVYNRLLLFLNLQKDFQELPSPEDIAKAKLQTKKKPAYDADII